MTNATTRKAPTFTLPHLHRERRDDAPPVNGIWRIPRQPYAPVRRTGTALVGGEIRLKALPVSERKHRVGEGGVGWHGRIRSTIMTAVVIHRVHNSHGWYHSDIPGIRRGGKRGFNYMLLLLAVFRSVDCGIQNKSKKQKCFRLFCSAFCTTLRQMICNPHRGGHGYHRRCLVHRRRRHGDAKAALDAHAESKPHPRRQPRRQRLRLPVATPPHHTKVISSAAQLSP